VISPGTGVLAPVGRELVEFRDLDISTGISGPHDFAVRDVSFVGKLLARCDTSRPSHPKPNARDDREAPLSSGRDAGKCELDLPDGARVLFVATNLPDGATRPRCAQLRESGFTSTH
jgi:hypothetical protein